MESTWREICKKRHCYLWIAPFFVIFAIFSVYPALYGLGISLTNHDGFGTPRFIGFENYVNLFSDSLFWKSLGNTVVLWALIVPARTLLALILASVLNSSKLLGRRVYTIVSLLPYVTAVLVVANVFRMLLATQGGIINVLLSGFGIGPVGWLDTTQMSKISVAVMNIWRMTGYFAIVLLAGMQKISSSVNEAAELDGAGPFRKFLGITIPLMGPEIFFVVLMSSIWVLQNMGDVMVLTKGGPINSSMTLVYYIYKNAFEFSKMGYASAMSYVLFLLLMIISIFSVKGQYSSSKEDKK